MDSIPKWLRGFKSHEPINVKHGEVGTVSKIVFETGGQETTATETVIRQSPQDVNNAPVTEIVYYDRELQADGMWSLAKERFIELEPNRTLWESENEYRFESFLMRAMGLVMKRSFIKQQKIHMRDFKAFAERGVDVRNLAQ